MIKVSILSRKIIIRFLSILIGLVQFTTFAPLMAQTDTLNLNFDTIEAYIENEMQEIGIPGGSIAIVHNDQIVFMKGFGSADVDNRNVTAQTPFILGSTGKSITALAVMQLVETGQIDLDMPVQHYIPWFQVDDLEASMQITIRHLLTHTSGLPARAGLVGMLDRDTSDEAIEKHVRSLSDVELSSAVGERFEYSNSNYTVLGLLIQTITGQSYESYIDEHVLEPLDMNNSFMNIEEAVRNGLADGHIQWFTSIIPATDQPYVRGEIAAGFHISTAEDMSHYLIALLNGGCYRESCIVSPESIQLLHQPAIEAGKRGHYAFGWGVSYLDDTKILSHGGAVSNYLSDMFIVPEENLGVIWLSNISSGLFGQRMMLLTDNIIRMILGYETQDVNEAVFLQIYTAILVLILLIQMIDVIHSLRKFMRIYQKKSGQTSVKSVVTRTFAISTVFSCIYGMSILFLLPTTLGMPLNVLRLFQPDLGWFITISGTFALVWTSIRLAVLIVIYSLKTDKK